MSYGIKRYDADNRNLTIEVVHRTTGREGTRVAVDVDLHLCPNAGDPGQRVAVLRMDLWTLYAPDIPAAADELARVLERVAAGLREGPDAGTALFARTAATERADRTGEGT